LGSRERALRPGEALDGAAWVGVPLLLVSGPLWSWRGESGCDSRQLC